MNTIYFLPLSDSEENNSLHQLLPFVSEKKQEKIKRFRFDIDRKLSLYSELMVRVIASQTLKIPNREIVFGSGEWGKPKIEGHPEFHYNISHTRNAVMVAIADGSVGADIEKIKEAEYGIAKRFFTAREQEYIVESDEGAAERFYEVWTRKEAYCKYLGKGLSLPLNTFDVTGPLLCASIVTGNWGEYIWSVCARQPDMHFAVREWTQGQVERMALSSLRKYELKNMTFREND